MKNWILILSTVCLMPGISLKAEDIQSAADKVASSSQFTLLMPVIEGLLSAVRQGKADQAYNEFGAEEFKKATTQEQFKQFVEQFSVLSKNKSFQFHSLYFENNIGTFQGALVSTGGDELETEFDLIEENGKWKILGIQLFKPESATIRPDIKTTH